MTALSDELLLAYLDGQLDVAQAEGIAALARDNPEISRRLLRLKRTQTQLMETFSSIRRENRPLPVDLRDEDNAAERRIHEKPGTLPSAGGASMNGMSANYRGLLYSAAGLLLGLGVGYAAHLWLAPQPQNPPKIEDRAIAADAPPPWTADIARFHAFFPRETLNPHPDAITNPELIGFQLAKVSGKALTPPDFTRQNYTLVRGQAFNYAPVRMMQLTYASKNEPPLVLYVTPGGDPLNAEALTHEGFKSVAWASGEARFLLAAEKTHDDLQVLAAIAQSQIGKRN